MTNIMLILLTIGLEGGEQLSGVIGDGGPFMLTPTAPPDVGLSALLQLLLCDAHCCALAAWGRGKCGAPRSDDEARGDVGSTKGE